MTGTVLEQSLQRVTERLYKLRVLRWQTLFWLVLLIPAILIVKTVPQLDGLIGTPVLVLLGITIAGLIWTRIKAQRPSPMETARLIESRRPELNDALLTAVTAEQRQKNSPSLLNEWAIEEADKLAQQSDWRGVVPQSRLISWSALSLVTFCFLITSVLAAASWQPEPMKSSAATKEIDELKLSQLADSLVVEPGDVEIEQGSPLTVVANFGQSIPSRIELQVRTGDKMVSLPMTPTVDEGIFAVRIGSVTADSDYQIKFASESSTDTATSADFEGQLSQTYRIDTFVKPKVLQIDARISPPSYLDRSPTLIEDTRRVTAVEGSEIELRFKLNKPVQTAELTSKTGDPLALSPMEPVDATSAVDRVTDASTMTKDETWYSICIKATSDETFQVNLRDQAGREPTQKTTFRLKVTRNERPKIKVTFPGKDTNVSPLQEFLVEAKVTDDFGLQDFGINYSLSGGEFQELSLKPNATEPGQPANQISHTFLMEQLRAEPDQLLSYSFFVSDFDSEGHLRRTDGDLMMADVRRFEEIFREGQQGGQQQQQQQQNQQQNQQQSQAEELLKVQREILVATWNTRRLQAASTSEESESEATENATIIRDSQQSAMQQIEEALQEIEDEQTRSFAVEAKAQMESSLQQLENFITEQGQNRERLVKAIQSEQSAIAALMKMRARETEVRRSQQQQQGQQQNQNSASQQQLRQLELKNEQRRYESEQQAQQQQQESSDEQLQRQIQNRLKDLARRQSMLNDRMKQLQAELRSAETDDEKQEIERELKRLRDEQQENLRDADELLQAMDQQSSQQRQQNQQAREQAEQARQQTQQAARAMDEGNLSKAISEGTRAERQFDEMQEQFRQQTSSQFSDAMKDLRQQARDMQQRQEELSEQLQSDSEKPGEQRRSLRDDRNKDAIKRDIEKQKDDLERVLEEARDIVEKAEESEPLLSRRLYDTVKEAKGDPTKDALDAMDILVSRGLWDQTQQAEEVAAEGIDKLTRNIENAADSVLGSQAEALRRAGSELKDLTEQLSSELKQRNADAQSGQPSETSANGQASNADDSQDRQPSGSGQPQESNPDQNDESQPQNGQQQSPSNEDSQQRQGQGQTKPSNSNQPSSGGSSPNGQRPPSDAEENSQPSEQNGSQGSSGGRSDQGNREASSNQNSSQSPQQNQSPSPQSSFLRNGGRQSENGGTQQAESRRPLTGDDYRQWSNRMREVEEVLEDDDLRNKVAQVRDRARAMRADFRRHGKEPKWDLVESEMLGEMLDLQRRIDQELRKLNPDQNSAPIDREPVPEEFDELVRRYYELLGRDRQETRQ